MKTRMIAVTAAVLLAAASLMSAAGAESVNETAATEVATPTAITETTDDQAAAPAEKEETPAEQAVTPAEQTAAPEEKEPEAAPASDAGTPAAAQEQTAETQPAELAVANVKTHHRFTEVAQRFQVKVGRVSSRTKVCMWSTDCRKANTMMRRLSADETLTVVAQSNGWYKVVDSQGVTGFVVRSRVAAA